METFALVFGEVWSHPASNSKILLVRVKVNAYEPIVNKKPQQ